MKFDLLCDIVLEGKKLDKFARMVIGNATPRFSMDDLLRVPGDPSKGLVTYLSHRDAKSQPGMDPERLARRAVRRLNWVGKSAIKKLGGREISLGKLNQFIIDLLDKYQTKVLGYDKPDKMRTAQEARVIGNILLPPTKHRPNAKGVFVPAQTEEGAAPIDAEQISSDFNAASDDYIVEFDPDLIDTIKEIVNSMGETDIKQIMKDDRIRGIYDSRVVRKVVKSLIDMGAIEPEVVEPEVIEDEGIDDAAVPDVEEEEEDIVSPDGFDPEDESEIDIDTDDDGAAARLGYGAPRSRRHSDHDYAADEDEDEEKWY